MLKQKKRDFGSQDRSHLDGGPALADNPFWVDQDEGGGRARFARTLLLEGGEASLLYPRCLSDPGEVAGLRWSVVCGEGD